MSSLEQRLEQDKAMRDAARQLLEADLSLVRGDVQSRSLTQRAADGVSETSHTLADQAMDYAKAHPFAVTGGIVALLLVLFRNPILDFVLGLLEDDEEDRQPASTRPPDHGPQDESAPEPGEAQDRSRLSYFQGGERR